ncbi:MAG: glycosyltransferase [Candidatus Omnitrophota bacterium]
MEVQVSVIIPTFRREVLLAQCLDSVFAQDYPQELIEIIVIDDGGSAPTAHLIHELRLHHPHLRMLSQDHQGPAAARNLGVTASRGDIICFIDDDCVAAKSWVTGMVSSHRDQPLIAAIGGLTLTATDKTAVLLGQFLANGSIETGINGNRETIFFPTCNVSFKRHVLEAEKFNEAFPLPGGEDLELSWRLYKKGHRFLWKKDIQVTHYRNDTLQSCMGQAYKYGRGNFLVQSLHGDHPLLKELRTGNVRFWMATLINTLKIPRFSYILGTAVIREHKITSPLKKAAVYALFSLHKVCYIAGNIVEFFRVRSDLAKSPRPGKRDLPELLILDITHACNLSCRICDIWKTSRDEKEMDLDSVKKMLSQAKELGIGNIALSGGEVLSRADIFEILDHARALKIKDLGILSNGILIHKNMSKLKPYLLDKTISPVVSLDSLQENRHNHLRNSDTAWQETVEGLRALSALKKEHFQVSFHLIAIIYNDNLEELPALVDFARSLGANSLQFQALLPNNLMMAERKSSPFWVREDRLIVLDEVLDHLIRLKEENPGFIKNSVRNLALMKKYYRGTLNSGDAPCRSAGKTVLVSNQGTCATCFSVYGDIRKHTLREILTGPEIVRAQKAVEKCHRPCLLPCFCD